jgi:predicted AAA+ superfamily ATPase
MNIFDRSLTKCLSSWFKEQERKPLLLRGARQVGKSWAVKQWCKNASLNLITINFEERPQLATIFEQDRDTKRILNELSALTSASMRDPQNVLFFDEVQKAPKAIEALRYLFENEPKVNVLAAGSLVEFVLEEHGLPVGRVQSQFVFPLTFVEFLTALNKKGLSNIIEEFDLNKPLPIPQVIHKEILSYLKLYFRVGGMPRVVSTYLANLDLLKATEEQAVLISGYVDDLRKYAKKTDWVLLETILLKMGALAGNGQVKFSSIDSGAKSPQVRRALNALCHALVLHKIAPTTATVPPLPAHASDKKFKLAFLDVGLLHHILGFDWGRLSPDADLSDVAEGRFAEQFVAQELIATRSDFSRYNLHFWERAKAGSDAEVDFVIERENSVIPIEVKSGAKGRLRSLAKYIEEMKPKQAIVLSQRNVEKMDNITFLPLYLACRL